MAIIDRRTVFVLGAGASKDYNFPLGSELKERMLSFANNQTHRKELRDVYGFAPERIESFAELIQYGNYSTIDELLERKPSYGHLGKHLIALSLMPVEREDALFNYSNWYESLFQQLNFGTLANHANLAIITLNYDRSLEHFLHRAIKFNVREGHEKTALEQLEQINIVHLHGSLGDYPQVPYGVSTTSYQHVRNAAQSIKIISDDLDSDEQLLRCQELIESCQQLYFFGFGYHETTLTRLLNGTDAKTKNVMGTYYGLDQSRLETLKQRWGARAFVPRVTTCSELMDHIAKDP